MSINGWPETSRAAMTTSLDWVRQAREQAAAAAYASAWRQPAMRAPRQHRRLHDGATLYDPETGQQVKPGCQIGAKCTGANR